MRGSVHLSIRPFIGPSVTPFHLPSYRGVLVHLMPCIRPCSSSTWLNPRPATMVQRSFHVSPSLCSIEYRFTWRRCVWERGRNFVSDCFIVRDPGFWSDSVGRQRTIVVDMMNKQNWSFVVRVVVVIEIDCGWNRASFDVKLGVQFVQKSWCRWNDRVDTTRRI